MLQNIVKNIGLFYSFDPVDNALCVCDVLLTAITGDLIIQFLYDLSAKKITRSVSVFASLVIAKELS